jgi:aminocarboxymuconate-semialdehyde decarboxylase
MPWQWVTPEQGVHIAQITNDASIEAHKAFPDRILFGLELPVGYAAVALAELNRVGGKPGLVAVHIPNSLAEREYLFEPAFAPVLARIEDLGLPLLIHPLDSEPNWYGGHRLHDAYSANSPHQPQSLFPELTNSDGETYEQAATVAKLIVSGALDKYPNLNVIICQGGGAFPYILGRLARGGGAGRLKYPVHSYIRRFHFVNLTWYPPTLKYLIDLVGSDRVVSATGNIGAGANAKLDTPAPTAPVAGPYSVIDQLDLAAADRDLILRGNLQRLFKL